MISKEVLRSVRRIEVKTRAIMDSLMGGAYRTVFKGNGMEFAEVRPYAEGDDIRSIDWNVTARTGHPYIKRNIEERELIIHLLIDVSASDDFGSGERSKAELAAELAALIGFSAIRNNDQVGMTLFSDRIEYLLPSRKGRKHVLHMIREMLYFKPEGSKTDLSSAINHFMKIQKKRAVVFLISDFRDSSFEKSLRLLARHHDLIAVRLEDDRELELPPMGLLRLRDAESGEVRLVDTGSRRVRKQFREVEERRRADLSSLFLTNRVESFTVSSQSGYVEPLIKFFRKREGC